MSMRFHPFVLLVLLLLCAHSSIAQQLLSGTITDENNIAIPFARIYVKNQAELRTQADANGYYEMRLFAGEYYVIYNALGYDDREAYVSVRQVNIVRDIQLFPTKINEFDDVEASAKKSNPGRDIMLEVVKKREQINPWNYPHKVDVYIKATEKITRTGKEKESKKKEEDPIDPFENEAKEISDFANNMNLVEVQIQRNYGGKNQVKEFRNAYTKRGNDKQLYYTTTVKSNFNFFENLLHLNDLHQTPVSSPISGPGILSYKYRLEAQYEEKGQRINKIKIIARNTATTTLSGYIYVIDSLWLIQKLELTMEKGNLLSYDYFTIEQQFSTPGDSICILKSQKLTYGTKFKDEISECQTVATFSNYNFTPNFPPKYFGNELAVTEKDAYERDSTFWKEKRLIELSDEEKRYIIVKDSIHDRLNRKEYLDSIDSAFNRVTFFKVIWFGVDHRDRAKRTQWTINSIAAMARPLYIAGPRVAPGFSFFKKWENQKYLDSYSEISMGILNKDLKGRTWYRYLYDPFHFGKVGVSFSHEFDAIRSFDAITQIYKRSNFIEATEWRFLHDFEYFNGFYINPEFSFIERRALDSTKYRFLKGLDNVFPNDEPSLFKSYQAALFSMTISYTPQQKYMREPYRKVLLGSKWPTFYAFYEKGIPKLFGSDINHDYLLLGVQQTFKIGTLGTTNYHVKAGKFLNTKVLKDADLKYPRRSDPFWFSNPLYSFQDLDTSLASRDYLFEGHIVHHDNGAIINKLPFMKKTGIGLAVGAGALYAKEFKILHYEMLAGLERNFKFSKRRLRIGIYAVASGGNYMKPTTTWKISFAVLDDRSMKWNF